MENIDKYIKNIVNKGINEDDSYEIAIKSTFKTKRNKMHDNKLSKIITATCSLVILTTGIVYAKDIINYVTGLFNENKGAEKAIESGYIATPNVNCIESNNVKVNVENFLMDDFNMNFIFNISLDDSVDISSISRARLPDLIIKDEENRILYCQDENNLNKENIDINGDKYISSGSNWYIKNKDTENNRIQLVYNFYSSKYPKSKTLNIKFNKINLTKYEISENEETILNGEWNIKLDVPEKFYNREVCIYNVKSCSDSEINVTNASLYDTGFRIEFNRKVSPIYNDDDSDEVKKEKMNKLVEWNMKELDEERNMTYDDYVINEAGEKFYPIKSSLEDSRADYLPNGEFSYMQTFDLTKYNENSNHINIHLKINLPNLKEEVEIELERKIK